MSAPRIIPDTVRDVQIAASNPDVSAWVAANAGSGKTHVLAQRVIRLLLRGVEPARILCITFTKAAAANMANRVFDRLAAWTALDDRALDQAMKEIGVREIDAALRARARQLFALALETPGGLKVQTIHAFCTHLLHLFPFEARVAARFTVLDETRNAQLLDQLCLSVLLDAAVELVMHPGRRSRRKQIERLVDQVVVVEQAAAIFFGAVAIDHFGRDCNQRRRAVTHRDGQTTAAQFNCTVFLCSQPVREVGI